jgi:hypothetical protein
MYRVKNINGAKYLYEGFEWFSLVTPDAYQDIRNKTAALNTAPLNNLRTKLS